MEIKTEKKNNCIEIKLIGRLDSNTSLTLEKELTAIINEGEQNIIVNFEELNYISSSGLRVFLVAAKSLGTRGNKLKFCNMKDFIKEVFDIAGFTAIFDIYKTNEDALKEILISEE